MRRGNEKRHTIRRVTLLAAVAALCLPVLLTFVVFARTSAEIKSDISTLNARMETVKKQRDELQSKANAAEAEARTIASEISALTAEIDHIDEELIVVGKLIDQFGELITEQTAEIKRLGVQIDNEKHMIDDMIRMSYEYDSIGSVVEFLFSAESFSDMISRIDMLAYHLSYNDKVLENYVNTVAQLETTKADMQESLIQLSAYQDEQTALRVTLEEKQAEAEAKKAEAEANAAYYENEASAKEAAIAEVDEQVKALAEALVTQEAAEEEARKRAEEEARKRAEDEKRRREQQSKPSGQNSTPSTEQSSSGFILPLPRGVYVLTSYYGYRSDPFTGKTAYHNGYDLACVQGTPIYAAASGKVMTAGYNTGGYGNYVIISHAGGLMTLYAHASSLNCVQGQQVNQGDVIAYVGTTGRSTGPHLHFTMYKDGALTDPNNYVKIH